METKTKNIIIIALVIAIIAVIAFFGINYYLTVSDEANFKAAITNASAIENQTDIKYDNLYRSSSITYENAIAIDEESINTKEEEIQILQNYSTQARNPLYKNYTDLEIERLSAEKTMYQYDLDGILAQDNYFNGNASASDTNRILSNSNDNVDNIAETVNAKKQEAQQLLDKNQDLKNKLFSWDIDEDFLMVQSENYGTVELE